MKQKLFDKFAELFGNSDGVNFYFSPGRVNLIGEHTDYNGGHVFPCALTLGTYGAARKREDRKIHFYSMNLDSFGVVEASLDDLTNKKEYNWANYPLGVVWAFAEKGHPISSGFDMVIWGNIPNGSGLSSSASLEVLTGVILSDLFDIKDLSMTDLALIGQYSENNFNGCNCESWISLLLPWERKIMRSSWIQLLWTMSMHLACWTVQRSSLPTAR